MDTVRVGVSRYVDAVFVDTCVSFSRPGGEGMADRRTWIRDFYSIMLLTCDLYGPSGQSFHAAVLVTWLVGWSYCGTPPIPPTPPQGS